MIQALPSNIPAAPGRGRAALATLAAGLVLCLGLVLAARWQEGQVLQEERRELRESILAPARFLSETIALRVGMVHMLEDIVRGSARSGDGPAKDFEHVAAHLRYGSEDVRALVLAPGGVIRCIHPLAGNETALGLDLLHDSRPEMRADAQRAVATGRVTVSAPYELRNGGLGMVARKSVDLDGRFWGLVMMTLDVRGLLAGTTLPHRTDLVFALAREGRTFYGDADLARKGPVVAVVSLPDGPDWELWAAPREGWDARTAEARRTFLSIGAAFVVLLLVLIYGFLRRAAFLRQTADLFALQARTSESLYRRVFDSVLDGLVIFDARGRVLSANPAACAMHGRRAMEGLPPREFVAAESLPRFQEFLEAATQGREFHGVGRGLRPDGTTFPLEVCGTAFALGGGRRALAVVRDQSEQERLRSERERFFELNLDMVGIMDMGTGAFRQINGSWTRVLGYEPVEIIDQDWRGFVHSEDLAETVRVVDGVMAGVPVCAEVNRWRAKDGTWRWLSWSAQPDTDRGVVYTVARDVTGEREAARQLRAANEELAAANEELAATNEEMAATNEELLAEIGRRNVAEDRLRTSLAEKEVLLKEIHHRVKNNLQVVSSLLGLQAGSVDDPAVLALFEEGKNRIASMALVHEELYRSDDLSRVDLRQYLDKLVRRLVGSLSGDTDVALVLDLDAAIRLNVDAAIPCGLLVNELVTNALKHGLSGRPSGRLEVRARLEREEVFLRVADDGPGFPADLDFHNTESLGMQLVVHLAEQLQGSLDLEPGPGCAFAVTFPLRKS